MKKGFTLAEVLITLGIIGVVAAMTIPTLLAKNFERQTIVKLRETQSIIAQALKIVEEEYDTPENWGLSSSWNYEEDAANKIADKMKLGLKITLDCGTDDSDGKCLVNKNYKYLAGGQARNYATDTGFYKVVLNNGVTMWWGYFLNRQIDFFIDTNGKAKPNTVGKDLFAITYIFDKGLFPDGHPTEDDSPWQDSCKKGSTGWGCAYYILHFENMNYLH